MNPKISTDLTLDIDELFIIENNEISHLKQMDKTNYFYILNVN
jgi:hypothetical protein